MRQILRTAHPTSALMRRSMLVLLAFLAVTMARGQSNNEVPRAAFGKVASFADPLPTSSSLTFAPTASSSLTFAPLKPVSSSLTFPLMPLPASNVLNFETPPAPLPKVLTFEAPLSATPKVLTWDAGVPAPEPPPSFPVAAAPEKPVVSTPEMEASAHAVSPVTLRKTSLPQTQAELRHPFRSHWAVAAGSTPMSWTFTAAPRSLRVVSRAAPTAHPTMDPYSRGMGRQETWIRPVSVEAPRQFVLPTTPPIVMPAVTTALVAPSLEN